MFDWQKAFKVKTIKEKCKFLTATLTNIFHNFIPRKTKKMDYKTPERINSKINFPLKERKKLAKMFYKNSSDYNKNNLFFPVN